MATLPTAPQAAPPGAASGAAAGAPGAAAGAAAGSPGAGAAAADRLDGLMLRDAVRLRRRLDSMSRTRDPARREAAGAELDAQIDAAAERLARRQSAVPVISYPPELPVSERRDDIRDAIRDHQVVVLAGETGSGKTTQLPKICLELGRGVRGMIGHTQPRRIAARTVSERIAEELDTPLGEAVGYTVRFHDQVGPSTLVKVMTDGVLLAEIGRDRDLLAYDTLILDEAHERSLNIDFLLGYIRQLLPRRPDLKVVITSATIDPGRFARHFGDAPVIEVSGRTYPVEVRYRPVVPEGDGETGPDRDRDQTTAICDAVDELALEAPGDVLIFLSGEREIRDTADALRQLELRDTEVLPLYARLSAAEQHRVFASHPGRRLVLATNVAETSLTVPGIRYVVDAGTARISRYSFRTKVQRLPIEAVSQASANQRKGRCGRVADGICIRLYSEEDFLARPEFTDPEILRTNLAAVILAMTDLGLGDIGAFPFLDPPDRRSIRDGIALLDELGALEPAADRDRPRRLTPLGRRLAALPVDPRLARMVLEAERLGCVHEVLVIAAALSIQDPRERPADKQQAADERHARFRDKTSDFLSYLNLWRYLQDQQRERSSSSFRRMCTAEFLHYLRVREWQDLYGQLRQVAKTIGIAPAPTDADPSRVHVALLTGLLSQLGAYDSERRDYLGSRGTRFTIWPGSALAKRPPAWVMAAELVETSRLWGRTIARIDPAEVEPLAAHLVARTYSEPHWSRKRGSAVAYERVTLYGLPIVARRLVPYGSIDPELSRELFLRHALVEGDWTGTHAFLRHNAALLDEVEELEARARRRDLRVDDETLLDFYAARVPADVVSARHFDAWWKDERRRQPDLLDIPRSLLVQGTGVDPTAYPDEWRQGGLVLPVSYAYEPGTAEDGVTVEVPLAVLNQLRPADFEWQVPGLRLELVTALIRSLPKALRLNFVPAPDFARAVLARLRPGAEPLLPALGRELGRLAGVVLPAGSLSLDQLPDHLRITFRVVDERGREVAAGKDLAALQAQLAARVRAAIAAASPQLERRGLREWDLGTLPREVRAPGPVPVQGYPALVDEGDSVAVRLLGSPAEQRRAMWRGTRRLLLIALPSPVRLVTGRLGNRSKLALAANPDGTLADLVEDCAAAIVDGLLAGLGGPAWDADGFGRLRDAVRARAPEAVVDVVARVEPVVTLARWLQARLREPVARALQPAVADLRTQLDALVFPGFVTAIGAARLPDLLRYLRGMERRLETMAQDPERDRLRQRDVEHVQAEYARLRAAGVTGLGPVRWMIEELRVSYFAQSLGTAQPVSEQRVLRAMAELESA